MNREERRAQSFLHTLCVLILFAVRKKMLALNTMSAEEIRKLTGLTIREMNKILKDLK